ncbi:PHD finger protein 7-like isoform X2 [Tympanuchus pallidicinctus]|uniref:PHD finger protein 7-like isoform X2 n=1 Tax=Tympanuchus pallidicinctus TaxID=109042 RepID=UPI002286CE78|nr:PHD finger protein 7-like isoform X2 [Tympanuchus pallidicinctus]
MGQRLCKWFQSTAETQEAAGSREPACVLCGRVDQDSSILGEMEEHRGFYFHKFCVIFINGLYEDVEDHTGLTFWIKDLIVKLRQAEQTLCFVCGKRGATITCAEMGCDRSFHLPCASKGECVTQYFGEYRSFCMEHCPQQPVEAAPAQDTTCIICMDPVGDSMSYSTMVCPACQNAWFHRACIQEQAMSAGCYQFRCPHCRDKYKFVVEMRFMGIRIPVRRPTWEDNDAYASLLERHGSCDASVCLCPHGREQAEEEGPWQLLLCSSCAAQGTHRCCSNLSDSTTSWECNACAGEGTASSTDSGLPGCSTTSQAPSGPANSSPGPESSGLSSQRRSDRRRMRPRAQRDEDDEPRRHRGSSRNAAPTVGSRTPNAASQETSASSRRRQGQRARTRSRSPLQRRAPDSPSQPRTRRGSRQAPASRAESCTHTNSRQGAPRSSRVSTVAERTQSRQTLRARTRSRSPLKHQAAETNSQPQRRRRSRSRRPGPARGRSRSRVPRRAQSINRRPH